MRIATKIFPVLLTAFSVLSGAAAVYRPASIAEANAIRLQPGDSLLFQRGDTLHGVLELCVSGTLESPVTVGAWGEGDKPRIVAPDSSDYAVRIKNSEFVTIENLDVINHGTTDAPRRTGVKVEAFNFGTSEGITLRALDIHDVNGSLVKDEGGGSGILIISGRTAGEKPTNFDRLTIEDCTIRRCQRNGMIWSAPWSRRDWNPSTRVIVRRNLIEGVPGDGIVPIGCDGAVIEYNLMRSCPQTLPMTEAAAGIWPWSCDNTIIRFNEVSDHKAPWDAQGFDSDYNCTNTLIEYNYSHDNDGGFLLVCNAGPAESDTTHNIGNLGSIVRYNVSIDDAVRRRPTREGMFSPSIHIAGPVRNTLIERNIIHSGQKPTAETDRHMLTANSWSGYADNTTVRENIFFAPEPSAIELTESTRSRFIDNRFLGEITGIPSDGYNMTTCNVYEGLVSGGQDAKDALDMLFETVTIADGAAYVRTVSPKTIENLFTNIIKH